MKKKNSLRLRRALSIFSIIVMMFSQGAPAYASVVEGQETTTTEVVETPPSDPGGSGTEGGENNGGTTETPEVPEVVQPVDKTVLQQWFNDLQHHVDNINNYTPNSVQVSNILTVYEAAAAVLTNEAATVEEVNQQIAAIETAINLLVEKADKATLQKTITKAKSYKAADYTKESFQALQAAIQTGEAVFNNQNATTEQVGAAISGLDVAISNLQKPATEKPKPPVEKPKPEKPENKPNNNKPSNKPNNSKPSTSKPSTNKPAQTTQQNSNKKPVTNPKPSTTQATTAKPEIQGPSKSGEAEKLDENLVTDSLTESDLNGFELPLLSSYENKNDAALVSEALRQLNTPFAEDGKSPDTFNNLDLPNYLYQEVFDIKLGDSYEAMAQAGEKVKLEDAKVGDLLFWEETPETEKEKAGKQDEKEIAKVALYLGEGKYIMADDTHLKELEELAKEKAELLEKELEAAKTDDEKEAIEKDLAQKIPGVRIFTIKGYQKDGSKVTIDPEKVAADETEDSEENKLVDLFNAAKDEAEKNADTDDQEKSEDAEEETNERKVETIEDEMKDLLDQVETEKENPTFAVHIADDLKLTENGEKLIDSYAATVDFRVNVVTQKFIDEIAEDARELGLKYDVYASVMIAQAILETGSGGSTLSKAPHYNLFGIKGSHKGSSVNMKTMEDKGNGSLYQINANFRSYSGFKDSLTDYVKLIRGGISGNDTFYQGAWRSEAKNYLQATKHLTGRYATDTKYNNKLNSIIDAYNLTQFDEPRVADATGTATSMIIEDRAAIPTFYREKMIFPDYNGKNYNSTGSYPVGQCTWYVYNRITQLGGRVDNFMGNGGEWGTKGSALGYKTTQKPTVGYAVSFHPGVAGSSRLYGHVAFVEAVGPDGILVSEGNVVSPLTVSYRVIPNSIARSNNVTYIAPK